MNAANYKVANKQVKLNQLKQTLKQDFGIRIYTPTAQAVLEKLQIAWENCYKMILKPSIPTQRYTPLLDGKQGFVVENNRLRLSYPNKPKLTLKKNTLLSPTTYG